MGFTVNGKETVLQRGDMMIIRFYEKQNISTVSFGRMGDKLIPCGETDEKFLFPILPRSSVMALANLVKGLSGLEPKLIEDENNSDMIRFILK